MAWEKELEEKKKREALAEKMGGEEKVARQHSRGKMDVRARVLRMADPGSFREIGKLAGKGIYDEDGELEDFIPANFVFGKAEVDRRPAVIGGDDFTVRGGAADAAIWRKAMLAEQMAHEWKLPLIRLIDGTGGGGSVKSLEDMGLTYVPWLPGWEHVVKNLDSVPVVSLALGSVAGLGAARVVASHYSVMVKGISHMFTAGPAVVAAIGENLTKDELGGAEIHARNGAVDDLVGSEEEAFAAARTFLSYLPSYAGGDHVRIESGDMVLRRDEALVDAVPEDRRAAYSMRKILNSVMDRDSVFEIGKRWGQSAITALARLDGWPVAVIASDPSFMGGSWSADAARKVERFVKLANTFRLPVVHFVDNPGFMIGLEAEKAATIRYGVDALNGIYNSKVPWATIVVRKAYGVAGAAMSNHTEFQYRFAWPSGDWGSLPLEGGIEVAYKSELEAAEDPAAHLEAIKARLDKVRSPFRTAEAFMIEDVIDPRETRPLLCEFAELAQNRLG
ncbi:acyl-CoA carboxylase subunit beta [Kordiimonas sp. SCSIO 12610]|uniref:acyl-CoA carboxylase subunit beta n=1 Tax=Kordiimonas sp. SCSIO 12610 TaxID=2829597 RepID=UPI00210B9B94|nr:carboxyl transferase domain-containing protein [Kordiimonas sp. SCSIO 12610]UTW56604.1 methylmalonyl-CoA carboxyltransferase [Kordiimonas sp. SCSIO 12610]